MDREFTQHLGRRGALNPLDPAQRAEIDRMLIGDEDEAAQDGVSPIEVYGYYLHRPVEVTLRFSGKQLHGWVEKITDAVLLMNSAKNPAVDPRFLTTVTIEDIAAISELGVTNDPPAGLRNAGDRTPPLPAPPALPAAVSSATATPARQTGCGTCAGAASERPEAPAIRPDPTPRGR